MLFQQFWKGWHHIRWNVSIKCVMALMTDKEVTTVDFLSPLRGEKISETSRRVLGRMACRHAICAYNAHRFRSQHLTCVHGCKNKKLRTSTTSSNTDSCEPAPCTNTFKSMCLQKHRGTCLGTTVYRQTKFKRHFVVFLLSKIHNRYTSMQLCISHTLLLVQWNGCPILFLPCKSVFPSSVIW